MTKAQRQLVRMEVLELENRPARMVRRVNEILDRQFKKILFRVKPEDSIRLLKLLVWQERHQVPLEYILHRLVPVLLSRVHKRYHQKEALGIRISSLTGKGAERILQEEIRKDFPEQEHISEWEFEQKTRIIEKRWQRSQFPDRKDVHQPKSIEEYESAQKYVISYGAWIKRRHWYFAHQTHQLINRRRAYRGNPWLTS